MTNSYRKLLSIVMTGRDDDYMLDFKYRVTTTINHIARNLQRLGHLDEVEIVVVDWGSEVPLAEILALTDEAVQICRFIYVPIEIVKAVQNGKDSFHNSKACNAGIRRATGEFVMCSASDTLIPMNSLEAILRLLQGELTLPIRVAQTYFLCNRVHAPWQFVQSQPDLDEWDRYLLLARGIEHEAGWCHSFLGISRGGQMMHASLWKRFRGLAEQIGGWGFSDLELMIRVSQYYPWLELSSIGVMLCHMGHSPYGKRACLETVAERDEVALAITDSPIINDDNWGLFEFNLDEQKSGGGVLCLPAIADNGSPLSQKPSTLCMDDISTDINSDDVRATVKRTLLLALHTSRIIKSVEIPITYFVCWYALRFSPKSCLEFGSDESYSVIPAAIVNPAIEIYYVDRFVGLGISKGPCELDGHLRLVEHQGYGRFINGDPSTALDRLNDSFIGDCSLDLIVVRGDIFEKDAISHVEKLAGHLAYGGALIYSRSITANFCDDWTKLQTMFPDFCFIQCKSAPVGIILKFHLPGVIPSCLSGSALSVCVDFDPLPSNFKHLYYSKIFELLTTPSKYSAYSRRAIAKLRSMLRRLILSD